MYIAKVFCVNYPVLKWTIKSRPKNYVSVNEPLPVGFVDDQPDYPKPFHPDLEPISLVRRCALNIFDGTQHEDDLYQWCLHYVKWIPKTNASI